MLAAFRHYPFSVNLLLSSALFLTLGRAITLPYMVISARWWPVMRRW